MSLVGFVATAQILLVWPDLPIPDPKESFLYEEMEGVSFWNIWVYWVLCKAQPRGLMKVIEDYTSSIQIELV